jgi:hypothetical protein
MAICTPSVSSWRNTASWIEVFDEGALRDLDEQGACGEAGRVERAHDVVDDGVMKVAGRDVDTHVEGIVDEARPVPCAGLAAGLLENPASEWDHEPRPFGDGDEISWWHQPVARVVPAHECLRAEGLVGG